MFIDWDLVFKEWTEERGGEHLWMKGGFVVSKDWNMIKPYLLDTYIVLSTNSLSIVIVVNYDSYACTGFLQTYLFRVK